MFLSYLMHFSLHVDVPLYVLRSLEIIVLSLHGDCIFCHKNSADPDELSHSSGFLLFAIVFIYMLQRMGQKYC